MNIRLKASISLISLSILLHTLAFFILVLLPLTLIVKSFIASAVLLSFFNSLRYGARKNPDNLIALGKNAGLWWGIGPDGQLHRLKILPDTVVTGFLICFHARNEENKLLKTLIFSWELDRASYRKLSVALRLQ